MKTDLLALIANQPYFTLTAIKQLTGQPDQTVAQLVSRWTKQKRLIRLKQGCYMANDFYVKHGDKPGFMEMVSSVIQPFSYLSREYILQKFNVLTDITYPVTSITEKNTQLITNSLGEFKYSHLKPELFFGFQSIEYFGVSVKIASKAKALFDYLYLRPLPEFARTNKFNLAEDLRLNLDAWAEVEKKEFGEIARKSNSPKMYYIIKNFEKHIW